MKRLAVALCILGTLGFVLSPLAMAKSDKADKVTLCHATDLWDVPQNEWTVMVGHRITVSANAVDAHLAHGDSLNVNDINAGPIIFGLTWLQIATNLGMNTEGATCAAFILDLD